MIDYTSIGYSVKQIRHSKGVTQEQLADPAGRVTHISRLEASSNTDSLKLFLATANHLDYSADETPYKKSVY